ncbi:MAG: S9 family peptidase [Planctomycetota bacterium]|nr:S9 family peptidase [Planctomycetota bacterium]
MVFHLHGYGGRLFGSVSTFQKQWADARGWLLVGPDGRGSQNYDHIGEDDFFRVLDDLRKKYNVDGDRLYLVGVSMGGHGCYRLAFRFPDLFAASAPVAGWTDYREFYPHWYEQAYRPKLPDYVDPTRLPLLIEASSLYQAENSKYVQLRIAYGLQDTVNPPVNAIRVIEALDALGYPNYVEVAEPGGHGAGYDVEVIYRFFEGKSRVRNPKEVVYVTNRLRHAGAYWLRIKDLTTREAFARLAGIIRPGNEISISASNVRAFSITLNDSLVDMTSPVRVLVNGALACEVPAAAEISLYAVYDDMFRLTAYSTSPPAIPAPHKNAAMEGPINEALLSRFLVVYGASGTPEETAANLRDARLFAAQWNGWTILRWGMETVPPDRADDWFVAPYPFAVGAHMSGAVTVTPISDIEASAMDTSGYNLILFGNETTNSLTAALASSAGPIRLAGGGIEVGGRSYFDPNIGYAFIYPRPDAPSRSMVVFNGYFGSLPEIISWGAFNVGKDWEQLPFQLPDYVVYDKTLPRTGVVVPTSEFDYLPECYLEAGFFDADWGLDTIPPRTSFSFDGVPDSEPGVYLYGGRVRLEANDNPGGTGVSHIEYRLNGGPWRTYSGPFWLYEAGDHTIEYRASDVGSSFLYGPSPETGRRIALSSLNNVEPAKSVSLRIRYGSGPGGHGFYATKSSFRISWTAHNEEAAEDRWRIRARLPREMLSPIAGSGSPLVAPLRPPSFGDVPAMPAGGATGGLAALGPSSLAMDLGPCRIGPVPLDMRGRGVAEALGGTVSVRLGLRSGRLAVRLNGTDIRDAVGVSAASPSGPVPIYMRAELDSGLSVAGELAHAYRRNCDAGRGRLLPGGEAYISPVVLATGCEAEGNAAGLYEFRISGLWFPGGGAEWRPATGAEVLVSAGASFAENIPAAAFREVRGLAGGFLVYRAGAGGAWGGTPRVRELLLAPSGGRFRLRLSDVPADALGLPPAGGSLTASVPVSVAILGDDGEMRVLSVRADIGRKNADSRKWRR